MKFSSQMSQAKLSWQEAQLSMQGRQSISSTSK